MLLPLDPDEQIVEEKPRRKRTHVTWGAVTLVCVVMLAAYLGLNAVSPQRSASRTSEPQPDNREQAGNVPQGFDQLAEPTKAVEPKVAQGSPPPRTREPAGKQAGNDAPSNKSTTKHQPYGERPAIVVNAPVTWPKPPLPLPRPTPSMSENLLRSINQAREDMANAKYESAYRKLHPLFTVTKPDVVSDMQLWMSFLDAHSEALNGMGLKSTFEYWDVLHDNGIAWHELMKQAMAAKNTSIARVACGRAEECYKRVARSGMTSSRLDREHLSLVGRAMENIAVLKLHFADYTNDVALYRQARGQIKECWGYLARHFGASSGEYQSSVAEWNKQDAAGKSRGGP